MNPRWSAAALGGALSLLIVLAADARVGGGDSYSGSDSSSSSSSSSSDYGSSDYGSSDYGSSSSSGGTGGSASFGTVFLAFIVIFVVGAINNAGKMNERIVTVTAAAAPPADMTQLRQYDANFSEIVFTDFCYSLYARVYEALGRGEVDRYAPYVSEGVRNGLKQHRTPGLSGVDAIVIGSFTIVGFRGLDTPRVEADVEFESNYTETATAGTQRWYVRERWTLTRERDLLSPAPANSKAEHCPKCGAALQTRSDGACSYCNTIINDGAFHWFVSSIAGLEKHQRSPRLGGPPGVERGLERVTVYQPWIARKIAAFAQEHPGFTWEAFDARVRLVANELQTAWTARDWKRARPFETDALFQMHRYWIDEYLRQGLRNIVDRFTIENVDVVKIASDAFYDAITVRLFASGADFTMNDAEDLVGGSRELRRWSEYWTLVRSRAGAAEGGGAPRSCPNCGATLAQGQTAICEYCGGKITTGEFPWVLSRIEQDEAYRG